MKVQEFVSKINSIRLNNKGNWYTFTGAVEGKTVSVKGFGTWLQIFNVDSVRHGGSHDLKVGEFKKALAQPF